MIDELAMSPEKLIKLENIKFKAKTTRYSYKITWFTLIGLIVIHVFPLLYLNRFSEAKIATILFAMKREQIWSSLKMENLKFLTYYQNKIGWSFVITLIFIHALPLIYFNRIREGQLATALYTTLFGITCGLGITAGAHRLWAHRSYKAKWPLQIFLLILNTLAIQRSVLHWCRDHRVHHKYTETDADPHNAKRGFFFAHMGWLMIKKHPDVTEKGQNVDLSDLYANPLLRFQHKYYVPLAITLSLAWISLPVFLWNEKWSLSILAFIIRVVILYHSTWLVNSAAHLYGYRPYDKTINPRENWFVAFVAMGEGFHNYHHVFPWDYSTSEFGIKLNMTTMFINVMAWLGQAYDLKKVKDEDVRKRAMRTGEHNHHHAKEDDLKY